MIELIQQVVQVLVDEAVAPAVARTGDLDRAVQNIKFSVARYMHEAGLTPEILARHFGKSERSIYRYFEQVGRDARRSEESHEGAQLMVRILEFFYSRREALPADACVRYLRRQSPGMSPSDISGLLDLYASMGHLRRITEEEGGQRTVKYQAPEHRVALRATSEQLERMRKVRVKLRALLPLVLSYARQEEGSTLMLLQGRVSRRRLVLALADINSFAVRRWSQALEDSVRDDVDVDELIEACALVIGGPAALEPVGDRSEPARPPAQVRMMEPRLAAM